MSRLPRLTGKEIVNALAAARFEIARVKGSHYFLRHAGGRVTVVPVHAGAVHPHALNAVPGSIDFFGHSPHY